MSMWYSPWAQLQSFTSIPGHQLFDDVAQGFAQASAVGAARFQAEIPQLLICFIQTRGRA